MVSGIGVTMIKNQKKVTRSISPEYMKWLFEDGTIVKLLKDQHLFITRGTGQWFFSFPAGVLKLLHRKLLRNDVPISMDQLKKCIFVMDLKGVKLPNGDWIKFEEEL